MLERRIFDPLMPPERPPFRVALAGLFPGNTPSSPSLALGNLKAYAESRPSLKERVRVDLIDGAPEASGPALEDAILAKRPDLVGFTCFIWNIEAVRDLGARLKKRRPGLKIVLGGHEVMWSPEAVLRDDPRADFVVCGEGEATFAELLERLSAGESPRGVRGLAWRDGGRIVVEAARPLLARPEEALSPYVGGSFGDLSRYHTIRLETSRGCPFKCRFCSGWRMGAVWREFPLERLDAELAAALPAVREIHLVDSDPCARRERGKEIFRLIGRRLAGAPGVRVLFGSYLGNWDLELARIVAGLGPVEMTAGIQSVNAAALRPSRRFFDEKRSREIAAFLSVQPNVQLVFELLLGLPGDDADGYRASLDWALSLRRAKVLLTTMLVTPGSDFARDPERDGIRFNPLPPHDVVETPAFPKAELDRARRLSFWISFLQRDDFLRDALWRLGKSLEGRRPRPYLAAFETMADALAGAHPAAARHAERFAFADVVPWEEFDAPVQRGARLALRDLMRSTQARA